jgi:hypothetical protein
MADTIRLSQPAAGRSGRTLTISAAQIWLLREFGVTAMIGLRLAFYVVWHLIWGSIRLSVLF